MSKYGWREGDVVIESGAQDPLVAITDDRLAELQRAAAGEDIGPMTPDEQAFVRQLMDEIRAIEERGSVADTLHD